MRRLAAVVGAVAMVVLAVAVRARLDGEQRGTDAAPAVLVCSSELADVCRALDAAHDDITVRIEDAAVTQAALTAQDASADALGIDVWLAPAPMAEMVRTERDLQSLEPLLGPSGPVLARTPTVMLVWGDRLGTLEQHCGGEVTWACVAEAADKPWSDIGGEAGWGDVKVGFSGIGTADGMLNVAAAAGSLIGRTDYASNDFGDLGFQERLGDLARSSARSTPTGASPTQELLTKGPAAIQIAAGLEADAVPAVRAGARGDRVQVRSPDPVVTADVVATPIVGAPGAERLDAILSGDELAELLANDGWRVDGQPTAPGIPTDQPLPDSANTPSGGVLLALRRTWTEVS